LDKRSNIPRSFRGVLLDRFQIEAIEQIEANRSVIVSAPTGAGKTLIAEYAIEQTLRERKRIVYTAPIKALSNQKFRDLRKLHGDEVGIMTGDVTIRPESPVLVMTTEIFRNRLYEGYAPEALPQRLIFDEIHFLSDRERGTVWEESLILAPAQIRLVCLSATLPNLQELAGWISEIRGEPVRAVLEEHRPVPLQRKLYVRTHGFVPIEGEKEKEKFPPLTRLRSGGKKRRHRHRTVQQDNVLTHVLAERKLPCLYFVFQRKGCESLAKRYQRKELVTSKESGMLLERFDTLCREFDLSRVREAETLRGLVARGVAYHHAGLLPTLKEVIEQCFATGLIKLIFTTETFAMGINMPACSVVFDSVVRFDGVDVNYLSRRDFLQMAGRAGRRGMDPVGFVYAQVEPRDYNRKALQKLFHGSPEDLRSSFGLSYASILNLYQIYGRRLESIAQKSFAAYQERSRKGEGPHGRHLEELHARRRVLERLGYLDPALEQLTAKGSLARRIYLQELLAAEWLEAGAFSDASPSEATVLATALVTEAKRNAGPAQAPLPPGIDGSLRDRCLRLYRRLLRSEQEAGVRQPTREPCFDLARAIHAWGEGTPFEKLEPFTDWDAGDLVRTFRQTIQLLNQIRSSLPPEERALRETFREAVRRINRDEVDAEKQLRGTG
jgi:superfamily II RNA helicase